MLATDSASHSVEDEALLGSTDDEPQLRVASSPMKIQTSGDQCNEDDLDTIMVSSDFTCIDRWDFYDRYYSSFLNKAQFGAFFELMLLIPTFLFSWIGMPLIVVIYSVMFRSALLALNAVVCGIVNLLMKKLTNRPRPNIKSEPEWLPFTKSAIDTLTHPGNASTTSMPSGDTAQSAVVATTVLYTMYEHFDVNSATWVLVSTTIPMCLLGRVYFRQHFLGDAIIGAAEGACVSVIMCFALGPYVFF